MSSSLKATLVGALLLTTGSYCHASFDGVGEALASGDGQAAMARFEALPDAERNSFRGRLLEAETLAAMGKHKAAERRYRQLIDEAPQRPEPYNNLAVLYADRGELDKALALLEKAIQTNASYATVRDNLSRIYLEKSLTSYAKALRIEEREKAPRLQALYQPNSPGVPVAMAQVASGAPSVTQTSGHAPTLVASAPEAGAAPYEDAKKRVEEQARVEKEKAEQARREKAQAEQLRIEKEKAERERLEKARAEQARAAQEKAERERLEKALAEQARIKTARLEAARAEQARIAKEQAQKERMEKARLELARIKAERAEQARIDKANSVARASSDDGNAAEREAVILAVKRWARAWQEQKVAVYLAAYAKEFVPPDGVGRSEWEMQRHRRLRLPENIEVALERMDVALISATQAQVDFVQRYRSDRYRDTTRKRLLMGKRNGLWQIREEVTLEVID